MKRFFKISVPIAILIILLGFIAYNTGILSFRSFPQDSGPKQVTLNCTYHGQKVAISENLYQSVDDYYSSEPKKRLMNHQSYVSEDKKDATIKNLTKKIEDKGAELGLSEDQTVDLATCFVQNIPYDSEKAKIVLSASPADKVARMTNKEYADRFPYETLYDNKGICTDKSYLESAILKEMGYGTALLIFDKEKHMAVGVKAPQGYTTFNTGYGYIETTNTGFKVGQLPQIDKGGGGAKKAELDKVSTDQTGDVIPEFPESDFSPPSEVIKVADGQEYERIIEISKEINRLKEITVAINSKNKEVVAYRDELKKSEGEAQAAKDELASSESDLNRAKAKYNSSPTDENYDAYRKVYDEYQTVYYQTKGVIGSYNANAGKYNENVRQLNSLIDEYNKLIKND
ncbi:MAG: transglutaminase-like domain-containing protein [Patescibacteria group bacterium]